jgi:hypothetical protein
MQFTTWTNDNVLLLFFLLFITFVIGFSIGFARGGWNQHLPYMFTLLICMQYFFISPLYFYLNKRTIIIGTDISDYYGLGVFFPTVGLIFFIFGYWMGAPIKITKSQLPENVSNPLVKRYIVILFCIIYCTILINMAIGGIDVKNIFLGDVSLGLGAKGETYFLQNFADSLISLIILAYIFGNNGRLLAIGIVLSFFIFTLLGFRYRILLTLFGLSFSYLYLHKLKAKAILVGIVSIGIFFYFIMLVTENRFSLIKREYSAISFDPRDFDYTSYFEQTRGSLADMAIYKVYDNPNKSVSHDYGASMFAYIFIRMIPRVIYPDKDRFYPPPQNKVQFEAYDAWWGKSSGEAILSSGCFYIAFGWPGVIFFHLFWGILLRKVRDKIDFSDKIQIVIYLVLALVTFQWITRAYLPQAIDHATYLLIPVLVMRYLLKP